MAWVTLLTDGTVLAVGFNKTEHLVSKNITQVEIPDDIAFAVRNGNIDLQHCLSVAINTLPAAAPVQPQLPGGSTAWATLHTNGTVLEVGFARIDTSYDPSISQLEIPYAVAVDVLEGRLDLQHCVSGVPPMPEPISYERKPVGNSRYPSMLWDNDQDALISLAQQLPANAIAVEIGSRLGGSALSIMQNAPRIKRLYCIDNGWKYGDDCSEWALSWIRQQHGIDEHARTFDYASQILKPYPAARLLAFDSPYDLGWWTEPVDFIFEDSAHENPQLRDNLAFWVPKVKSGGIIAGHDYTSNTWIDVKGEADRLAEQLGVTLFLRANIWYVIKP